MNKHIKSSGKMEEKKLLKERECIELLIIYCVLLDCFIYKLIIERRFQMKPTTALKINKNLKKLIGGQTKQ